MDMLQTLVSFNPLSAEAYASLEGLIFEKHYIKGSKLLDLHQVQHYLYFIGQGSARTYYVRDGHDITDYFALDGHFIGGLDSLITGNPSVKAIEATEDSIVQIMPIHRFISLCDQYHEVETLFRKMVIFAFLEAQKRIEALRFLSAAERYSLLEEKYPGISNRIPLKYIASYLGITQVSLSRIRAGIQ